MLKRIPQPVSGGVILSYQCVAECRFCMYACSPKWKECMSAEMLGNTLDMLAGKIKPAPYGPDSVSVSHGLHFTGGEPFMNFDLLLKAARIAGELKIPSTFVETNCFWCNDETVSREKLKLLKYAGLKGIMISVNPFYLEFIPFERVETAIKIALDVFEENVMIYQWDYFVAFKKMGIKGKLKLEDYLKLAGEINPGGNIEMFLQGRASYKLKSFYKAYPASVFINQPCFPEFLRNWHNHFDNYGNIMPGFCGGISLGQISELDTLITGGIELNDRPVLKYIIDHDFAGLMMFAHDSGYEEQPDGYISKCHLCLDIRRHLARTGNFKELKPEQFYTHLDQELSTDL